LNTAVFLLRQAVGRIVNLLSLDWGVVALRLRHQFLLLGVVQRLQRAMLQGIGYLRRLALSVEQRDTLPHGCHEGFVGPLELLGFALGVGLPSPALARTPAKHRSKSRIRPAAIRADHASPGS